MEKYKEEFIEFMINSKVLKFGEFKTKSGRIAPYFINTGNYKTGEQITKLGYFYAECIKNNVKDKVDLLFGPAYKGIPLVISTSIALYSKFGINISYSFNRKEVKDHGEGGNVVGYIPKEGDNVIIVEDVTTAGTSVRECVSLFKTFGAINIKKLIISVDRMERGNSSLSARDELNNEFGIETYSIVNIKEIIAYLHNKKINGTCYLDDSMKEKIEVYLDKYGVLASLD